MITRGHREALSSYKDPSTLPNNIPINNNINNNSTNSNTNNENGQFGSGDISIDKQKWGGLLSDANSIGNLIHFLFLNFVLIKTN